MTRKRHDDREHGPDSTGSFVRRLLHRVKRPAPEDLQRAEQDALPPSGQRSGNGASSAEAYLKEERNSRPAPLE